MERQGDKVTFDDVKQVAVGLIQEKYLLPIPFCFLSVLKSKKLDEVLAALLLYLLCYFEQKSLQNKSTLSGIVDIVTEHQLMTETSAKTEISLKNLAVHYFSLMMDLEREHHLPNNKSNVFSNKTEWLLNACLYSFFCYFAWVTFNSRDLKDIQEEVGRLLYSDAFNEAVKKRARGDMGNIPAAVNGSAKVSKLDGAFKPRARHQHPSLHRVVNQRSPLMLSLLPLPREQSSHLFRGSWAVSESRPHIKHRDTKALTEQLHQQLDSGSFGIIGKPLSQFSRSSLIPYDAEKNPRDADQGSDLPRSPC
uniref:Protein phosphatase 1 regulatory subunit 36 n=2 Tax=Gouania willdenowi TaxID=441366 RepID=A0A8C5EZJ4_GOUWI